MQAAYITKILWGLTEKLCCVCAVFMRVERKFCYPLQKYCEVHYKINVAFVWYDEKWRDISLKNVTVGKLTSLFRQSVCTLFMRLARKFCQPFRKYCGFYHKTSDVFVQYYIIPAEALSVSRGIFYFMELFYEITC